MHRNVISPGAPQTPPTPQVGAVGWRQPSVTPKNVGWPPRRVPKTPEWGCKQNLLIPRSGGIPEAPPHGPEGPLAWDGTHCHSVSV